MSRYQPTRFKIFIFLLWLLYPTIAFATPMYYADKFDLREIYEALHRCYPIDIYHAPSSQNRSEKLTSIIVDNIHNRECFEPWEQFTDELALESNKEIIGTTYGNAPSFSSFMVLDTTTVGSNTRSKQLHFMISLVGSFYTVIGEDKNTVKEHGGTFESTNYLVVSPEYEFEAFFVWLCQKIENRFTNFRFVPYEVYSQTMKHFNLDSFLSVFQGLFNDLIDINTKNIIGNGFFKSEVWTAKEYTNQGKWSIMPPPTIH